MATRIRGAGTARKGGVRWANLEVREAGGGWKNGPKQGRWEAVGEHTQ